MKSNYTINENTYLISQEGRKRSKTKIIEEEATFFVNKQCLEVIDDSCTNYGSSFIGQKENTKKLLNINIKPPIVVDKVNTLIFFPTASPKSTECIWISYNNLKSYKKMNKITRLTFKNNKMFDIPVTYEIIDNQVTRSIKLEKKCQ